jgi:predicted outer membrane protein
MQEDDRQVEDAAERVLAEGQQTLSDAVEDLVEILGIDVDTEAALSDRAAQRLHDQLQQSDDICVAHRIKATT